MALPTRLSLLGLDNPQSETESEYPASRNVCHPIPYLIIQQSGQLNPDTLEKQRQARSVVSKRRDKQQRRTPGCSWKSPLMTPNGWSTWLLKGCIQLAGSLACNEHGFHLHKTAFRDAICLRFSWKHDRSVYVEEVSQWNMP